MKKRLISMMLAIATAVSFTACSGVEANTSRTISVDSSSIAESTESTTSTTTDSKADATTTANSGSEVSSTTTTNSSSEDTTTESTSSTSPKEEKIEERDVYDEDGNVVDKIKVKVVDGVTYTIGTDNEKHYIKDNVALIPNDPMFVSGDGIACLQIKLKYYGVDMTQEEISKYFSYCTPDDWYVGEDGRNYGPWVDSYFEDPTKEKTMKFIDVTGSGLREALSKIIEKKDITNIDEYAGTQFRDESDIRENNLYITIVTFTDKPVEYSWFYLNDDGTTAQVKFEYESKNAILIGYSGEEYYYYFPGLSKIMVSSEKERLIMV